MTFVITRGIAAISALMLMLVGMFFVATSAKAETSWEPQSNFSLSVDTCSQGGAEVQTIITFNAVEGEQLGNFTLDGEALTGDGNAPTAGPGEHTYTYTVTNVRTEETVHKSGTFTVELCDTTPHPVIIEVPAPPTPIDPCGPHNAYYPQPADTEQVAYLFDEQGNLRVTPQQGYAFAGEQDYVYPAPADSNQLCEEPEQPVEETPTTNHPSEVTPNTGNSSQEVKHETVQASAETGTRRGGGTDYVGTVASNASGQQFLGYGVFALGAVMALGLIAAVARTKVRARKVEHKQ